jgi:hypothetical protein
MRSKCNGNDHCPLQRFDLPQNAGEDNKNKRAEASMHSVAYAGNN